ncbi:MAG: poly-gamma-glutamate biosynthesis protein PgsC [Christensenellaceae bacterium]|jgi:poly-gamma-glutamate biosynthesis protein PgsC/CapC|nr:poly-gamma-glutamate biosynthesis protein PgsC [Christensenellaceae bacterium]
MSRVLLIGILLSLFFYETTGVSPGGIIVPAYFALFIGEPLRMLSTLGIALVCLLTVKLLSNYMILYGRRRYAVYVLLGLFYKALLSLVLLPNPAFFFSISASIGYLVPGILAQDAERQGALKTLAALAAVTLLTHLAQLALGLL